MPSADYLLTNARVFTADPQQPVAEAVAVRGQHIVFAGSDAEAANWRGAATHVIDAGGGTLMPGFIDSHFHLLSGCLELGQIQLGETQSLAELQAAVRAYAQTHTAQTWLVGQGLRYDLPGPGQSLTRQLLDLIEADRPLVVFAYDHHTAWANTPALRLAGILESGEPIGPNSEIVRGPDGLATGELREDGAFKLITRLIPPPSDVEKRALLRQGLSWLSRLGITSVHNMEGSAEELALFAALEDLGELPLRVYYPLRINPDTPIEALETAAGWRDAYTGDRLRTGCVKFFMDGVVESFTALTLSPYPGQPGNCGDANFSAEHFTRMAVEADRLGLQIFVHAIGDAAVRRTLDAYETARRVNGPRDSRHRIEHIELIHPDDVPRFARLGVIASMQPLHAPLSVDSGDVWPERVGPERWPYSFAWQTLRAAGARLAFGSDWPVVTPDPMRGLFAALNRQPWAPGLPDQRPTLTDALLGYTRDAAYAEFQEQVKGQIRPGLLADLVLFPVDLFGLDPAAIDQAHPVLTMCGGQIIYAAENMV